MSNHSAGAEQREHRRENHTPEPWRVETWEYTRRDSTEQPEEKLTIQNDKDAIAQIMPLWRPGGDRFAEEKVNADRIVAAVNACAGIPTTALEAGVIAELREACRRAIPWLNKASAENIHAGTAMPRDLEQTANLMLAAFNKSQGIGLDD